VIFLCILGGALLFIAFLLAYHRLWPALFGAWMCTGWFGRMAFWTRRGAERYRAGSFDPYARGLQGPIVFQPGRWARRIDQ
jgi:hypothetical protein